MAAKNKKKDSVEEPRSSQNLSELLNLLSSQSKKKPKEKPESSISSLQEKILKLSGKGPDTFEKDDLDVNREDEEVLKDDLSAVDEALSKLLGPKPKEDSKLSPEVFSV